MPDFLRTYFEHFSIPMLLVDGALIAVFLLCIWIGAKRGLIKSTANILSIIGAWICASRFHTLFSSFLKEKLFLPFVSSKITDMLKNVLDGADAAAENVIGALSEKVAQLQEQMLTLRLLPEWEPIRVEDFIPRADTVENADELAASVAGPIAERLSVIASCLIMFCAAYVLLRAAFFLLDRIFKLPLLNGVNKMLGGIIGAAAGFVFILLAAQIISLVLGMLTADGTLSETWAAGPVYGFLNSLI